MCKKICHGNIRKPDKYGEIVNYFHEFCERIIRNTKLYYNQAGKRKLITLRMTIAIFGAWDRQKSSH